MPRPPLRLVDINVTPLIDVMLVLLIIFMVVTPVPPRGLDATLPPKVVDGGRPPLVLSVEEWGLRLNSEALASPQALEERLREVFATRFDHTLLVQASGRVSYGRVVEAMDAARAAGAERLGLISEARGSQGTDDLGRSQDSPR